MLAKITNLSQISKSYFTNTKSKIGDVILDATHMETIEYSSVITDHPVERGFEAGSGSSISDYIYKDPIKIRMVGSVTDSPIDIIGTAKTVFNIFDGNVLNNIVDQYKGKGRNQITAYEVLTDIYNNRVMVDVVSYLDVFSNMVIESLSFPRDNATGNRLLFEVTLKQITLADVKTISFSNNPLSVQDTISSRINNGSQPTKDPTPSVKEATQSLLRKGQAFFGI